MVCSEKILKLKNSKKVLIFISFLLFFLIAQFKVSSKANPWNPSETGLKTVEPLYESAFDIAGGATLTRATQDTSVFSNPALPALGAGFFRSINYRLGSGAGTEAFVFLRDTISKKEKIFNVLSKQVSQGGPLVPILYSPFFHLGLNTKYFGATLFAKGMLHLEKENANSGIFPSQTRTRSFGFGGLSLQASFPLGETLFFGISLKKMVLSTLPGVLNLNNFAQGQSPKLASLNFQTNHPQILDIGLLYAKRSKVFDIYAASVVNDLAGTKDKKGENIWPQTLNLGIGAAAHTRESALHCGLDYKDALKAYDILQSDKIFAGCRLIVAPWFAFALGSRKSKPSAGISLNMFVTRLELTYAHIVTQKGSGTPVAGSATSSPTSGQNIARTDNPFLLFSLGSEIP